MRWSLPLSCCLSLLVALALSGCGGGGAVPSNAQPAPQATEDFEAVVSQLSLLQGGTATFSDPAYVGDTNGNEDCRAFLLFDLSLLPTAPNITKVELIVPVTSTIHDPSSLAPIRLDHEGRATSALSTPDHLMSLGDEDLVAFDAPVSRGPGIVPTWTTDVTQVIGADLNASDAFALFRFHTAAGANGNGVNDGWILGETWAYSGLPVPVTLRVTYLLPQ